MPCYFWFFPFLRNNVTLPVCNIESHFKSQKDSHETHLAAFEETQHLSPPSTADAWTTLLCCRPLSCALQDALQPLWFPPTRYQQPPIKPPPQHNQKHPPDIAQWPWGWVQLLPLLSDPTRPGLVGGRRGVETSPLITQTHQGT